MDKQQQLLMEAEEEVEGEKGAALAVRWGTRGAVGFCVAGGDEGDHRVTVKRSRCLRLDPS